MNYTCHAVVLVCHVGPVTWQMFLSFHVIPIPFPPFQNIKKLSSRKSLGPALKKKSLCVVLIIILKYSSCVIPMCVTAWELSAFAVIRTHPYSL